VLSRVLNNLPLRYRVAVWIAGVVAFAGAGAWLAYVTPQPLGWQFGAAIGAVLGVVLVSAFLRVMQQPPSTPPHGGARLSF
jgi:hypothetical protein